MNSNKIIFTFFAIALLLAIFAEPAVAQCPMCKASAESSIKEGETHALGLNAGIMYLFLMPYLLFTVIGGAWYYNYRKNRLLVSEENHGQ